VCRDAQHCFRLFFNFMFDYLKEDKTVLPLDEAKIVWQLVYALCGVCAHRDLSRARVVEWRSGGRCTFDSSHF
jgi:hypothetical protein